MDPFLEQYPIFHELHLSMLTALQGTLQPQLRPRYVARLQTHDCKEDPEGMSKQRRITIFTCSEPRKALATIELLTPANKDFGWEPRAVRRDSYLSRRAEAIQSGIRWIEVDLLRGGDRGHLSEIVPQDTDYLAEIVEAVPPGRSAVWTWTLRDPMPCLPIPLLNEDQLTLDLGSCFREAYERTAAEMEADYDNARSPPPLSAENIAWVDSLLRQHGLRGAPQA